MLAEHRQRRVLLRNFAKGFRSVGSIKSINLENYKRIQVPVFSLFSVTVFSLLSADRELPFKEYWREDLEVVSLPQKNFDAAWSCSVCVFQVVNFPSKCLSGEQSVHVNDTRKCLIRSEQEQLFRWCPDMLKSCTFQRSARCAGSEVRLCSIFWEGS